MDFHKKAAGVEVLDVMPAPDGKGTMHAMMKIGDSILMMGDERPEQDCKSAETLGVSPIGLYVYVPNVDEVFRNAVDSGATVKMPVEDVFWGDRCGTVKDPFGYGWTIATHTRDLTLEEIKQEAESFFAAAEKS